MAAPIRLEGGPTPNPPGSKTTPFGLVDMNALAAVEPFAPVIRDAKAAAGGTGASKKLQLLEAKESLLRCFDGDALRSWLSGGGGGGFGGGGGRGTRMTTSRAPMTWG